MLDEIYYVNPFYKFYSNSYNGLISPLNIDDRIRPDISDSLNFKIGSKNKFLIIFEDFPYTQLNTQVMDYLVHIQKTKNVTIFFVIHHVNTEIYELFHWNFILFTDAYTTATVEKYFRIFQPKMIFEDFLLRTENMGFGKNFACCVIHSNKEISFVYYDFVFDEIILDTDYRMFKIDSVKTLAKISPESIVNFIFD